MKKKTCCLLMSIVCVLFISCSSTHLINIETQQPAKFTFPIAGPFVVVVNNAVPQPENTGFTSYQPRLKGSTSSLSEIDKYLNYQGKLSFDTLITNIVLRPNYTDSLLSLSTKVFSKEIQADKYFYEVSLFDTPLRTDKQWIKSMPISERDLSLIFSSIDADAILSIDNLLFLFEQHLSSQPYDEIKSATITISQITCSIYMRDREKPLTSFSASDTILNEFFFHKEEVDSLFLHQMLPESVLYAAAKGIGEKIAGYFTPTWKTAQRTLYTNQDGRMKEALAFSNKNKWQQAQQIWMELFDSNKNIKSKARLANNIAIAFEMLDDLEASSQWIEKSRSLYEKGDSAKELGDIEWITHYDEELKVRIQNNRLLDVQLGEVK